jgi:hypothetical protein
MRIVVALLVLLIAGCASQSPHGVVVFPAQPNSDGGGASGGGGGGMGM